MEVSRFVQDNDCHWYIIPTTYFDKFNELSETDNYDEFDSIFGNRRCMYPSHYKVIVVGED